jgi:hypothetical protein
MGQELVVNGMIPQLTWLFFTGLVKPSPLSF